MAKRARDGVVLGEPTVEEQLLAQFDLRLVVQVGRWNRRSWWQRANIRNDSAVHRDQVHAGGCGSCVHIVRREGCAPRTDEHDTHRSDSLP